MRSENLQFPLVFPFLAVHVTIDNKANAADFVKFSTPEEAADIVAVLGRNNAYIMFLRCDQSRWEQIFTDKPFSKVVSYVSNSNRKSR